MKVVLFCGGYGMRMRDSSGDGMPKPMQMVGPRPLIWHVMRYYAHFGHKEFILCLGYGAAHIKNYFLTYQEAASNDFVMRNGQVELSFAPGQAFAAWSSRLPISTREYRRQLPMPEPITSCWR